MLCSMTRLRAKDEFASGPQPLRDRSWNTIFECVTWQPVETHLVGYTDNVSTLNAASNVKQAQLRPVMVTRLLLSLSKMEIMGLTKKHIQTIIRCLKKSSTSRPSLQRCNWWQDELRRVDSTHCWQSYQSSRYSQQNYQRFFAISVVILYKNLIRI